jgi:hypothetical protein
LLNGLVDILFLKFDGIGSSRVTTVSCNRVVLDCIALGQKRVIWNGLILAPQVGQAGQERLGVLLAAGEHKTHDRLPLGAWAWLTLRPRTLVDG